MLTNDRKTKLTLERLTKHGHPLTLSGLMLTLRECEEKTQAEFAQQLAISRQQLCDIEQGRKSVSPAKAAEYARILGYSEHQFIALCLQQLLDKQGLSFVVSLDAKEDLVETGDVYNPHKSRKDIQGRESL